MRYIQLYISVSTLALTAGLGAAQAAETDYVFTLGQINVSAQHDDTDEERIGGSVLSADEMRKFNKTSLDKALNLVPGVIASNGGGQRNEQLIFVRGFDRYQVPLSIDGIRIYLPADNRLDFGRFLTPDLAEIQISKGYDSVLNGPGGMGGAINLVTRKPVKSLEAEAGASLALADTGALNGYVVHGSAGTRQKDFYFQVSGARDDTERFRLSRDFNPTANENGGNRQNSDHKDWRINAKLGYTPNATDEYSISFTRQEGSKGAPFHTTDALSGQRYWRWPYWNLQNIYWLSSTQLGTASYVKTRAYYNTFDNAINSYDDPNFTAQTKGYAFNSYYQDYAYGGSVELGTDLIPMNTLKGAVHYRRDNHEEWQDIFSPAPGYTEPRQTSTEDTFSVALENTFHATDRLDLVAGISQDWRRLLQADDWTGSTLLTGNFVHYALADNDAFNWQGAAIYRFSDTGKLHADISARTRFPTIAERFSSRFGGATSNPALKAERAVNTEIGWSDLLFGATRAEASVFYSDVKDVIQSVPIIYMGNPVTQNRNVGDGEYYGAEIALRSRIGSELEIGGNYTYLHRKITDPNTPSLRPLSTPDHKVFAYATYEVLDGLSVTPNVEAATNRWTSTKAGKYYKTGSYVLANFQVAYEVTKNLTVSASAQNLLDQDYQLTDGFPEQGRNFLVTTRVTF